MKDTIKYEFEIVPFFDIFEGTEYRYRFFKNGWLWGHFKTKEECEKVGRDHFNKEINLGVVVQEKIKARDLKELIGN